LTCRAFTTTNEGKAELMRKFILAFETQQIAIPDYGPLLGELEIFEVMRLPLGKFRYAAAWAAGGIVRAGGRGQRWGVQV